MYRFLFLPLLLLVSCTATKKIISYNVITTPVYKIDPPPQKVLVLNSNDIVSFKYRDNKEELFISLTNSFMEWIAGRITDRSGIPVQVLPGYTATAGHTDSTVFARMKENQASHAIIIHSFDVSFNQTHVDVVKTDQGSKNRTAYYDIVAEISYSFYSSGALLRDMPIHKSRFHSSRSVISGLLAAGPNIVAQRKDALDIILENGQEYLNYFFPGEARRTRSLFTGKEFGAVNAAIAKGDYEAALTESLRLIHDADKARAAKACYNCAVLFERKNQPEEAKEYLKQSLSLANLWEAKNMLRDFEF